MAQKRKNKRFSLNFHSREAPILSFFLKFSNLLLSLLLKSQSLVFPYETSQMERKNIINVFKKRQNVSARLPSFSGEFDKHENGKKILFSGIQFVGKSDCPLELGTDLKS